MALHIVYNLQALTFMTGFIFSGGALSRVAASVVHHRVAYASTTCCLQDFCISDDVAAHLAQSHM